MPNCTSAHHNIRAGRGPDAAGCTEYQTIGEREMAKIDFGGVVEEVVTREEFPLGKAREVLKDEVVAVLGYGVQGRGP